MTTKSRASLAIGSGIVVVLLLALACYLFIGRDKDGTEPGTSAGTEKISRAGLWKSEHQASLDRSVKWLLDNQLKDGRWGHFLPERPADVYLAGVNSLKAFGSASSALCCMALLMQPGTKKIDAALRKGYRYLIDSPDTARVTGATFYNIWSHSYMLQAISRGLLDERLKDMHADLKKRGERELKRLLSLQGLNGGWGYYDFYHRTYRPSGRIATPFCTATAIIAIKEARKAGFEIPEKRIEMALSYIMRMRFPNGAYSYSTLSEFYPRGSANFIRGSLGRSQACNNGLITWDRLKKENIQKGFEDFIEDHEFIEMGRCRQYPHEAWYATAPYYYYYGHYYASRNLDHLPGKVQKSFAEQLTNLIVLTQFDDGSFWDFPLYGYTRAYGTGFGALILSNCRKHLQ